MDRYLKLTGSLLAVELSCCDGVEVKVSRGIVSQRDLNLSHTSGILIFLSLEFGGAKK